MCLLVVEGKTEVGANVKVKKNDDLFVPFWPNHTDDKLAFPMGWLIFQSLLCMNMSDG